jgi:hypothetical protein
VAVRVAVHQPVPERTLAVWLDSTPDVSCTNSTQVYCVDVEHQPTDLAVGGSNPSRRATNTAGQRPYGRAAYCSRTTGLRPNCDHVGGHSLSDCDHLRPPWLMPAPLLLVSAAVEAPARDRLWVLRFRHRRAGQLTGVHGYCQSAGSSQLMVSVHHRMPVSSELRRGRLAWRSGVQTMARMGSPVRFRRGAPPARETGMSEGWTRRLVIEASFEVTAVGVMATEETSLGACTSLLLVTRFDSLSRRRTGHCTHPLLLPAPDPTVTSREWAFL